MLYQTELRWRSHNGAEGNRTPDLSVANAALSQLSYGPEETPPYGRDRIRTCDLLNAIQALSQLSYGPLDPNHGRDRIRTCDLYDVNVAL